MLPVSENYIKYIQNWRSRNMGNVCFMFAANLEGANQSSGGILPHKSILRMPEAPR